MTQTREEIIEIELSEPQAAVLESRKQLNLEMSGQGGGKSQNIGYASGQLISEFPEALGFIGANTYLQLSQSTLKRVFETWKEDKGFEEYDAKGCPWGAYVVDKKPPPHFVRTHKLRDYSNTISFYNGQLTFIGSLENYKAHEGKEFAWAHLDETKDTKEEALKEVILGRLRQYGLWFDADGALFFDNHIEPEKAAGQGWTAWNPLYIHTSPKIHGAEWLIKMFKLDKFQKEIKKKCQARQHDFFYKEFENKSVCIYSAYHNEHNLAPGYLQNQEINLVEENAILKLVDGYPFGTAGGEWLPGFRRDKHVTQVEYERGAPVHMTLDFNSMPYMTCLLAQFKYLIRYIDTVGNKFDQPGEDRKQIEVVRVRFYREYCLKSPRNSTESICTQFRQDHSPQETEIFYYGDANGLHKIPGLGNVTNFKILEDELFAYLHNQSKRVKDPNVGVFKRRDLVNDILNGVKYPEIEIEFDEGMENTIEDLENVKEGKDGKIKQEVVDPNTGKKYQKWGHCTDALEYLLSEAFKYLLKLG
jgi:hypothetical protein